ncbi:MAG: PilZ domain-containing protein [Treponema sp.]
MWFIAGFLILCAVFFALFKLSHIFHRQIEFILKGMDFGFNLSEIKLLWTTAKRCELSNPVSIYVSADVLTKCISDIKNSAEVDDTINYSNTQKILSKLYDFKAKIDSVEDKKRGLESTKSLDVGQKLRIILPGKGVFYSEILSNGHDLIIKLPTQKDQIIVEGKDWVNQSVSVYLWRKEDARYVFDTSVQGCGIFLGKAAIFLKHSSNLIRTQKRNSIRAKCDINGMLYIIRSKIVDYNAVENSGGYRCKIEDISEKGALIRIAGKGLSNLQIKIQFQLENRLIVMFGIVRTVEYNQNLNQSRLHFECVHIDSVMRNYILSYVYKILPQTEKDIFEAQSLVDKDEESSPASSEQEESQDESLYSSDNPEDKKTDFDLNKDNSILEETSSSDAKQEKDFSFQEIPEDL